MYSDINNTIPRWDKNKNIDCLVSFIPEMDTKIPHKEKKDTTIIDIDRLPIRLFEQKNGKKNPAENVIIVIASCIVVFLI